MRVSLCTTLAAAVASRRQRLDRALQLASARPPIWAIVWLRFFSSSS